MKKASPIILIVLTALLLCGAAPAAVNNQSYEPVVGQEGKDVIWID